MNTILCRICGTFFVPFWFWRKLKNGNVCDRCMELKKAEYKPPPVKLRVEVIDAKN